MENESNSDFEAGRAEGMKAGRREGLIQGRVNATLECVVMICKKLQMTPEAALALLELPRKERKTYLKIIQARKRQKG